MKQHAIVPTLWLNDQAELAVERYIQLFGDGRILTTTPHTVQTPSNVPLGSTLFIDFELANMRFVALNGGSRFTINPSISFFVTLTSEDELRTLWSGLMRGGTPLMQLEEYAFSPLYGWVQDEFGVSWQLSLNPRASQRLSITPSLLFTGPVTGRAEAAMNYYIDIFEHSHIDAITRFGPHHSPNREDAILFADFSLLGQHLSVSDTYVPHDFGFSPGVSLMVLCDTQEQIDRYWSALSANPDVEACGWLEDKYGVSWQIVPDELNTLINTKADTDAGKRAMKALLHMKKLDIAELLRAYDGK